MKKEQYFNGSDMLLYLEDDAIAHCTSHSVTMSSETKEHAVKPPASAASSASMFKEKTVTGLSYSVKTDGLVFIGETEAGYSKLMSAWKAGKVVKIKCMERGATKPYLKGSVVITSLERNDPAGDDSTYSASFDNSGAPDELDETVLSDRPDAGE